MDILLLIAVGLVAFVIFLVAIIVVVPRIYRKVDQGQALIINATRGKTLVTFTGGVVIPVLHRAEIMDISVKTIQIDRHGAEGLICQDNIRADIKVTFFVRVNKTEEDVLKVAQSIGCQRASDQETLENLFVAKFSEALKTVGKRLEFEQLYTQRDSFKDQIIDVIGRDLNGYQLEDAAIDFLEQTPLERLDKDNILDSQGISKITAITADQHVRTNDLRQNERKAISRQNLEADEAILELERRRADATARQQREIAAVQAREAAETASIQSEEHKRSELARIKAEEEIQTSEINKARQLGVADKDRERVLAIKGEEVGKARDLQVIAREREVEIERINKEKALEVERKNIADVLSTRIAVEKKVAEEEERIKSLRALEEAKRKREVALMAASTEAEEKLVKELKAAEAREKAAENAARERLTLANAALEAADKEAKAKIRLADGLQAEVAARGLAEVRVKEADAVALEKVGLAQARVAVEAANAEATGVEVQGMARVKVKDAEVAVLERQGLVEAAVTREKLLAAVAGAEAEAGVIAKRGEAEAAAISARFHAEADGLAKKLEAMKSIEGGREFEELRLRLEKAREIELATIEQRKAIASSQAEVMAKALGAADIKIMGGDGAFFDRFLKAVSLGESVDGFIDHSNSARALLGGYLSGESKLADDVKAVVSTLAGTSKSKSDA